MTGKSTKQIHVHPSKINSDLQSSSSLALVSGSAAPSSAPTDTPDAPNQYHPYIDEIEVGAIYSKIDQFVNDNEEDYRYMKVRVPFTLFAWISACLGIFVIFYGGAYTIAFQSVKKRFWLEIVGFVLCLPIILWFFFMFCASSEERKRRRNIFKKRKIRLEVYAQNPELLRQEAKKHVQEKIKQEEKEREEKLKAIELEKKMNPLKYPNKNVVTRHKAPE